MDPHPGTHVYPGGSEKRHSTAVDPFRDSKNQHFVCYHTHNHNIISYDYDISMILLLIFFYPFLDILGDYDYDCDKEDRCTFSGQNRTAGPRQIMPRRSRRTANGWQLGCNMM